MIPLQGTLPNVEIQLQQLDYSKQLEKATAKMVRRENLRKLEITQSIVDFCEKKLSKNKPSKSLKTVLETIVEKKDVIRFSSDSTYTNFLQVIRKAKVNDCELYKKILMRFRGAFGLPPASFDQSVAVVSRDNTSGLCSKEILETVSPYFSKIFKEDSQKKALINLPFSGEALTFFLNYLYTSKPIAITNLSVFQELNSLSKTIEDPCLQNHVEQAMIDFFLLPEHDALFTPDLLSKTAQDAFFTLYMKRIGLVENPSSHQHPTTKATFFALPLSIFQNAFNNEASKVQQFLIKRVNEVILDVPFTSVLLLLPKNFREVITTCSLNYTYISDLVSVPIGPAELPPELEKIFPNAEANITPRSITNMQIKLKERYNDTNTGVDADNMRLWLASLGKMLHHPTGPATTSDDLVDDVLGRSPKNVSAHMVKGFLHAKEGLIQNAIFEYREAILLNPRSKQAFFLLIPLLIAQGRSEEAKKAFQILLAQHKKSGVAHFLYSQFLIQEGKFDEALAELAQASHIPFFSHQATLLICQIQRQQGKLQEVEQTLRTLIAACPLYEAAYVELGDLLVKELKFEEAREAYLKAMPYAQEKLSLLNKIL